MDDIKDARDSAVKSLQTASDHATVALDEGVAAASQAAKQTFAFTRDATQQIREDGQGYLDIGMAHFEQAQEETFQRVREGLGWARENDSVVIPAGIAALTVILPGPRRFLWRQTLGRFRSEESLFRSAESKYGGVTEALEAHSLEGQKLEQRLAAAQEQYDAGLRKCIATAKQLSALQSRVRGTEKAATSLVRDLRELPSRDALALRAQAAAQIASAAAQRKALDRTLWSLSKKGLY